MDRITVAALQQMKRERRKIVGVVVYDVQMARIADRAGVDIVSVGDSVGVNMWGHQSERDVTLDEMLLACKAVRRGVSRAVVSCDLPAAVDDAVAAARVLATEGGAVMVKVETDADTVQAIVGAGVAVWAQIGGQRAAQRAAGCGQRADQRAAGSWQRAGNRWSRRAGEGARGGWRVNAGLPPLGAGGRSCRRGRGVYSGHRWARRRTVARRTRARHRQRDWVHRRGAR